MHQSPLAGDIVIRGTSENGFQLTEARTGKYIAGPFQHFPVAVAAARARQPHAIWTQSVDHRGRALGDLFELPQQPLRDQAQSA